MELLAFLGFFVMLVGAVSILVPLKSLGIRTRGAGVLVLATGLAVMGAAGSRLNSGSNAAVTTGRSTTAARPQRLMVMDAKAQVENYGRYVVGRVKNNSGHAYSYVQVEINLYDKSGNQVGSTLANANNLEAGGMWRFKAPVIDDSATKFRIVKVTGF